LPNDVFPLYNKYLNDIHQPCSDCWNKLDDKNKKLVVERLDKAIAGMKEQGTWKLNLNGIEMQR